MVKEKRINNETLFICEVCGLGYANKDAAEKCEDWCRKTGTCNVEITKKAVYFPNLP
jgi:rubrerythrin